MLQLMFYPCVYHFQIWEKKKKTRGRKFLPQIFVQCRAGKDSRRKRACVSSLSFPLVNSVEIIYHSIRCSQNKNLCPRVVNISTPQQVLCKQCWILSWEEPVHIMSFFFSIFFTQNPQKPRAAATCSTIRLSKGSRVCFFIFRLIPLEAIYFLIKTISYLCILPNYLKQTVGYAGSQITADTFMHTRIIHTKEKKTTKKKNNSRDLC